MKILHVCKKYPRALGGDAVVVANLQEQQEGAGHKVVVVTSNCDEIVDRPYLYKFGFKDTPSSLDEITLKRLASLVALFFQAFVILRKERPSIIHTHSIDMAFLISFAARFYHIPIVHTFHIVTFYDRAQSFLRRKTELWLAKSSGLHRTTAPNNYDVKKLQEAGLFQTVNLPNGVNLSFWGKATRPQRSNICSFLTIGRLEHQKGYEYLIKAAAKLSAAGHHDFHITIVGEGSQGEALRTLAHALHVEERVTFVGRKSPEEIRALLSQANAAIFPSLFETTPITMLEAWAAHVPVIITAVGIVRDVPSNFGAAFVIPPKNTQSLFLAMKHCMAHEQSRITVGNKGHEEARKYTWPHIATAAEAIYRSA